MEYLNTDLCEDPVLGVFDTSACPADARSTTATPCPSGEPRLPTVWVRRRDAPPSTGWGPWTRVPGACPGEPGFPAVTAADFQRLPLTPSTIHIEPPDGWTLANVPTIVFASGEPQTLRTTVLGFGVTVRATPRTFTWTFGDGSAPLATTDPGRPYPDATITHAYGAEGTHRVGLATQWTGEFLVDGFSTWLPVVGTAQTAATSEPLTVYTARSRLVAGGT